MTGVQTCALPIFTDSQSGSGQPPNTVLAQTPPANTLAAAGGTKDYFPATTPEQLTSALASISTFVASCSYHANQAPPDPDNVAVYVNKQLVDKSEDQGWKFGSSTQQIVLTGSYCEQVLSGSDVTVEILFGCPGLPSFPGVIP